MTRLAAVLAEAMARSRPLPDIDELVAAIPEDVREAMERALDRCQHVYPEDLLCGAAERIHGGHLVIHDHPYQPLVPLGGAS